MLACIALDFVDLEKFIQAISVSVVCRNQTECTLQRKYGESRYIRQSGPVRVRYIALCEIPVAAIASQQCPSYLINP